MTDVVEETVETLIYSEVGTIKQQIGGECPDGWTVVSDMRPSTDYVSTESGEWVKKTLSNEEQMIELEATITQRRLRNALLGDEESIAFIADVEAQIEALR